MIEIILLALLSCSSQAQIVTVTVNETHSKALWINIPFPVVVLKNLVNSSQITIDTYPSDDNVGWLSIECYYLESTKILVAGQWIDEGSGWSVKTKILVSCGNECMNPGQLILDIYFGWTLPGALESYFGCLLTQGGVGCHIACSINQTTSGSSVNQTLSSSDGAVLNAIFNIDYNANTNQDFVQFLMSHYTNKYEGKNNSLTLSQDQGNFPVTPTTCLSLNNFATNLLQPYGLTLPQNICENCQCFLGPNNFLVDHSPGCSVNDDCEVDCLLD